MGAEAAYTDAATAPHHRHVVKRAIVRHTATAEALREELRLFRGGIDPVFKRFQHDTNILILCLIINKKESRKQKSHYVKKSHIRLWMRSYFVETVGHISEKTVVHYIENQKTKFNALSSPD